MPIRDLFVRDLGRTIEGVVKVYDEAALGEEIREFVLTDSTEEWLKKLLDTFAESLDRRRKRAQPMDDMGVWVSGFFGSGKSHFAKLVGYVLQNHAVGGAGGETAMALFEKHLHDGRHVGDIKRRLGEIRLGATVRTVAFEIKSKQTLNNPNSVAEIMLSSFYEALGFSDAIYLARIEKRLSERGRYEDFKNEYRRLYGHPWEEGRKEHEFNRKRIAEVMHRIGMYASADEAREGIGDAYKLERITAESVAQEIIDWVDKQAPGDGRLPHFLFVIDEMGGFIGDDGNKIEELRALVEQMGSRGKGKVWVIATSQLALEQVCEHANLELAKLGKLNARFCVKIGLISDEVNKVVGERILKKREARVADIAALYAEHEGFFFQLADLKSTRTLGRLNCETFVASYPFLPETIKLAQDIFEALSGLRISGGVRSMIAVTQDVARALADQELGTLASFDQVFEAIETDLFSPEYLGASGILAIRESAERVPGVPVAPSRVLKVLWLLQQVRFIPRTPEVIAKLLVRHVDTDLPALRVDVEKTLLGLQAAGYVARDEATGEYKYLNERERTIEQEAQRLIREMGLGPAAKQAKELLKSRVLTKARLNQFQLKYGSAGSLFAHNVSLDGEDLVSGNEIGVAFIGPLSARKRDRTEIERDNKARGTKGRTIHWIAHTPESLEARLKRLEALRKVTEDERFTKDTAKATQDALAEKRKELGDLEESLANALDDAFRKGRVYASGDEHELDGSRELKAVLQDAGKTLVGNLYTRFVEIDKRYDFKSVGKILNPAEKTLLHVEPELSLFDSQGMLQRERAPLATLLEAIKDLEDENEPTGGASLMALFRRIPFGWPEEVVRLLLAAAFRGGALYLELPSAQGTREIYDYTEPGTADLFTKVNTFKGVTFRIAQTGLSVDELKAAVKLLARMDVTGVPEAGNAIAGRVRELGTRLLAAVDRARTYADFGLPLPDVYKGADGVCKKATTAKDPTVAVKDFLAHGEEWVALFKLARDFDAFLADQRDKTFELARRVFELCEKQPIPADRPEASELGRALEDAQAVIRGHSILEKWPAFRDAYHRVLDRYRAAYEHVYASVAEEALVLQQGIVAGDAYRQAPETQRDAVLQRYFGQGGPLHLPEVNAGTPEDLLASSARHSLTALQGILIGLPGWRSAIEAELLQLRHPEQGTTPPQPPPPDRTYEWRPLAELGGRRFGPDQVGELERELDQTKDRLKRKLAEGFTVIVK
ncbi:MAG: BREX system P-loop protein BrxC [Thermoanaerobaculia bacterium]